MHPRSEAVSEHASAVARRAHASDDATRRNSRQTASRPQTTGALSKANGVTRAHRISERTIEVETGGISDTPARMKRLIRKVGEKSC